MAPQFDNSKFFNTPNLKRSLASNPLESQPFIYPTLHRPIFPPSISNSFPSHFSNSLLSQKLSFLIFPFIRDDMPFISETASAIKSRFGFHSRSTSSDSAPSFFTSPDLSLKSVSRDNHPGQSLAATSAVRSIGNWDDNAAAAATASSHSFEFSDDPSFWKDHNVQVIFYLKKKKNFF